MKNILARCLILSVFLVADTQQPTAQPEVPIELGIISGDGQVSLLWNSEPGTYYEIFMKTNLTGQTWDTATGSLILSTSLTARISLPANDTQVFFQLSEIGSNRNDMVLIPAGSFNMGDSFNEGQPDELPVHSVYISGFYMSKYEVTKALWDEVYEWALDHGYSFDNPGSGKDINHPVCLINWYDSIKWCNARSEKEGLEPCYTVDGNVYRTGQHEPDCNWNIGGYRLPTEAEWEKACRGGLSGLRFPWGNLIAHSNANYFSVNLLFSYDVGPTWGYHPSYDYDPQPYTSPVDSFEPNAYGLYDMVGNVWDSCWDWYDPEYYMTSPSSDPRGPSSGSNRVERGTSWLGWSVFGRSSRRAGVSPLGSKDHRGFRVCLPVLPPS